MVSSPDRNWTLQNPKPIPLSEPLVTVKRQVGNRRQGGSWPLRGSLSICFLSKLHLTLLGSINMTLNQWLAAAYLKDVPLIGLICSAAGEGLVFGWQCFSFPKDHVIS